VKTAISIPDELFEEGERLAREQGVTRSRFYSTAIAEYVVHHRRDDVLERLNSVYAAEPGKLDPLLSEIADASLPDDSW